jgi:4'-phosphopantetheinyl transferase
MRIYTTEYPSQLLPEILQVLLEKLPEDIRQKAKSYRRWEDSYGCLLGRHLLRRGLADAGFGGSLSDLQYTAKGRPYLANGPHFNISHSGNRVVCVLSEGGRIGIDLEKVSDLPFHDFKTQFSDREWDIILNEAKPLASFYHYWTAKESVLKADGRGLNATLAELDVTGRVVRLDNYSWKIEPVTVFCDYACHIAYEGEDEDPGIKEFLPADLARDL